MYKQKEKGIIMIHPFMVFDLHLSGNLLNAYALIYGFSYDGKSFYYGGVYWLAAHLGVTKQSAITLLNKLVSTGLIVAKRVGARKYYYCAITRKEDDGETGKKTLPEQVKKLDLGSKETLPINKIVNKIENKVCVDNRQGIYTYFYLHSAIDPYSETERFIAYYSEKKVPEDKLESKLTLWDFSKRRTQPLRYSAEFATFWATCCTSFPKKILSTACSEKVREDVSKRLIFIPKMVEDWVCLPENEVLLNRCRAFTRTTGNRFCVV